MKFLLFNAQVEATLRKKYIVKMRAMLGSARTDDKVADILNRVVEKDEELWDEADPRHMEKMLNLRCQEP